MNQFKKAKQKAQESGKQTESITDIKTAGVAPTFVTKPTETNSPINIEETDTATNITNEEYINTTIAETKNSHTNNLESQKLETNIQDSENQEISTNIIVNTSKITPELSEIMPKLTQTMDSSSSAIQSLINASPVPHFENTTNETKTSLEPLSNIGTMHTDIPGIETNVPSASIPIDILPSTSVATNLIASAQTQPPIQEVVSSPKTTTSKTSNNPKNVPNIFTPKGEAKSMRKSLVLKPTSVKIAENYCAKNGGSFNELIQTLLDNFIEEYGL